MDLQIIRTRHPPEAFLPQIANLIEQAGLPATPEDVGRRLERLPAADRLILAVEGEHLVGYAHLRIGNDLVYEETAELMSIIVRASHRRRGIGRRLVTAAETWAAQSGRARLLMRTEVVRTAAHAFFVALGFRETSTNLEFVRDLEAARRSESPTVPSP
jgi:GNAT superfamily N-acetyltransferase